MKIDSYTKNGWMELDGMRSNQIGRIVGMKNGMERWDKHLWRDGHRKGVRNFVLVLESAVDQLRLRVSPATSRIFSELTRRVSVPAIQ